MSQFVWLVIPLLVVFTLISLRLNGHASTWVHSFLFTMLWSACFGVEPRWNFNIYNDNGQVNYLNICLIFPGCIVPFFSPVLAGKMTGRLSQLFHFFPQYYLSVFVLNLSPRNSNARVFLILVHEIGLCRCLCFLLSLHGKILLSNWSSNGHELLLGKVHRT